MSDRWEEMLGQLEGEKAGYWRERLAIAERLMDAFQTGQLIEVRPVVRRLLLALAGDAKWEVRKVIANGLHRIEDEIFDELAGHLLQDANGFVKSAAEQSYARRRRNRRDSSKREAVDRQLASRLSRLRDQHGVEAADEVIGLSEMRFTQLAGSMAHNLRSILTYLQPAASKLKGALGPDTDTQKAGRYAERLVEGLAFMKRCIADMERYTEQVPIERLPEDLAQVLKVACDMATRNIEELGFDAETVRLHLEVPEGLRLRLSRHHMTLAVANLVKNAYESFMERHNRLRAGEVSVTAAAGDDQVQILVRDNGMGMAPEDLDDLASGMPCRRNKAKRQSTGFGVPIARRYIEAHGGTLRFQSDEDQGTVATIALPRTPAEGAA